MSDRLVFILGPILSAHNSPPAAITASKRLIAFFIAAARKANRYFVAGPVWNHADSLIEGETQYIRYAFDRLTTHEVPFLTVDLEKYGAGDGAIDRMLEEKLAVLLSAG